MYVAAGGQWLCSCMVICYECDGLPPRGGAALVDGWLQYICHALSLYAVVSVMGGRHAWWMVRLHMRNICSSALCCLSLSDGMLRCGISSGTGCWEAAVFQPTDWDRSVGCGPARACSLCRCVPVMYYR
jgi:hypothetical protein